MWFCKIHDFFVERKHFYTSQNYEEIIATKKKSCMLCLVVKSIIMSELLHHFVGPCPHRTMALDPTFGRFTLLNSVSHLVNWFLRWKSLNCLDCNRSFWCSECGPTVSRCTRSCLLAGPARLWCVVLVECFTKQG